MASEHSTEETGGISVVVPVHNEEPNLLVLRDRLVPVLEQIGLAFEVILVDDGSNDGSLLVARRLATKDPRIRSVAIAQRSGQTAAMDAGFRMARHPVVVTLDADLQNDPGDIPKLLALLPQADVVCGVRLRRHDTWLRRAQSRIANRVRDWITGDHVTDTGCSLKVYRREYLRRLKLYNGMHRFLPTLLRLEGARVVEVPVSHHPRQAGQSKYGIRNRALSGLRDCLAVRWMRQRALHYQIRGDE
jgi:dolichol-phosphate mannosyltransferase